MKKVLSPLLLLGLCFNAYAGDIANGATVLKVANISSNVDTFAVTVDSSLVDCARNIIFFPASAAPNKESHARAYSTALTALSTGMKVRLYNYDSNSCTDASFIEISK
ncbi:hypothetical protein NBRC116188_20310 [Oceaniserpentilla sp. 4NH20-0058]|uniref:DUF5992 family protein n=1 Tax=Oceaniserpentilla sp. 4NH20-0058 TaxID=3127660 RepID=UPI003109F4DA